MKYTILLFSTFLIISCGTQQKTVENMPKETTTPTANSAIIDSVNAQYDKVAENDSLNVFQNKNNHIKKTDSVLFIKNAKFTTTVKDSIIFNGNSKTKKGTTDGYVTNDGETVTVEIAADEEKKIASNHTAWNNLLQKHVSKQGNVNYKGLKTDHSKLRAYITYLGENTPTDIWSKEDKLVYWINAYNSMTVDLILRSYPLKSIKDIKKPWDQRLWKLGEKWYNLNEVEHKILRKMNEPRIHFAINCASFSCPPLLNEAFSTENLEQQLTQVTKVFLADSERNTIAANKIEISKIFKWFSKDFKQNGSLIDFLNQYSDIKINANAKKSYKDYNWNLNELR
ncbi:DUF547 domain-containing protein [uncultured Kordia sp.]|uniref:DUF547 domain-containing protein n=1 Tax=uncultured Kordia sp. TaxID=507699 RepID=UPI00262B80FB|nr:DUF547 domain-containing protein [uncultured Kordia sp.]